MGFPCIGRIIEIRRQYRCKSTGASGKGARLFMASHPEKDANIQVGQIRQRWNVENKNHHPRDATLLEDKCRCRKGNTSANLALLRGAVLTIWRLIEPDDPASAFILRNQRQPNRLIKAMDQRLTFVE